MFTVNNRTFWAFALICLSGTIPKNLPASQVENTTGNNQRADRGVVVNTDANPYRYTRFGWQDAREWPTAARPAPEQPLLHPLWVSLALLLIVVGVLIWSSEEDEIAAALRRRAPSVPPSEESRLS